MASETKSEPVILQLPPGHGARLKRITRELVAALCHVDRLFKPYPFNGAWWLRLRDPDGPLTLLAADYYLLRRVAAMEQLAAILEEAEEVLEDESEDDAAGVEEVPLFVWGTSYGPDNFDPTN